MKLCILSQQHFRNLHISQDMINAFEQALLGNTKAEVVRIPISEFCFKINNKLRTYVGRGGSCLML